MSGARVKQPHSPSSQQHQPASPTPAALEFIYLSSAQSNGYVHRYSKAISIAEKISEIERSIADGSAEPSAASRLGALKQEFDQSSRNDLQPPEQVIASLHPEYASNPKRLLVARRLVGVKSPRYFLYRDRQALLKDVIDMLVWDDPTARNVPYSRACIYPMTEPGKPTGFFVDTEESFLKPEEDYSVITDAQIEAILVQEDQQRQQRILQNPLDVEERPETPEERIKRRESVRENFDSRWQTREADFAVRCRWVVALVRASIAALYGIDMGESAMYWFSACSRKKNSFHIYIPLWRFITTKSLDAVMANAAKILESLDKDHPCRVALTRAEGTERDLDDIKKRYIIDWGVYCDHRQMRAAFQRKDPVEDNAFIPYDPIKLRRALFTPGSSDAVVRWFAASLDCMVLTGPENVIGSHLFLGADTPLSKASTDFFQVFHERANVDVRHSYEASLFTFCFSALRIGLEGKGASKGAVHKGSFVTACLRLKELWRWCKAHSDWLHELVWPPSERAKKMGGQSTRYLKHSIYTVFSLLFVASGLRYAFSHLDPNVLFVNANPDRLFIPRDTPAMLSDRKTPPSTEMLYRTVERVFTLYMPYVALVKSHKVAHARDGLGGAITDITVRNSIWSLLMLANDITPLGKRAVGCDDGLVMSFDRHPPLRGTMLSIWNDTVPATLQAPTPPQSNPCESLFQLASRFQQQQNETKERAPQRIGSLRMPMPYAEQIQEHKTSLKRNARPGTEDQAPPSPKTARILGQRSDFWKKMLPPKRPPRLEPMQEA